MVPEQYKNISRLWLQSPELIPSKKHTTTRGSMTSAHCSPGLRSLPGCLCRPSRLLRPGSWAASQTSWRALCNQTNTIFETVRRGYGWQRQAKVILEKKCKKYYFTTPQCWGICDGGDGGSVPDMAQMARGRSSQQRISSLWVELCFRFMEARLRCIMSPLINWDKSFSSVCTVMEMVFNVTVTLVSRRRKKKKKYCKW